MRINNNLMAMNTHRQLGIASENGSKSMQKLSSGIRINNASDDAAGLAISEKMRGQIRGLNQASRNAQDAISLIQTAEGALNESHSILQRMRELAVQASTDTNTENDRGEVQQEINQLTSEINRISNTTEFNTMKLLNGDRSNTAGQVISVTNTTTSAVNIVSTTATVAHSKYVTNSEEVKFAGDKIDINWTNSSWATLGANASASASISIKKIDADTMSIAITLTGSAGNTIMDISDSVDFSGTDFTYNDHGISFTISGVNTVTAGTTINAALTGDDAADTAIATLSTTNDWDTNTVVSAAGSYAGISGSVTIKSTGDLANARTMSVSWTGAADDVTNSGVLTVKMLDSAGATLSTDTFTVSGTMNYDAHGVSFKFAGGDTTAASFQLDFNTQTVSTTTTSTNTVSTGSDASLTFQIGSNEGQYMSLALNDMSATALGIAKTSNGAGAAGFMTSGATVTNGTDSTASYFALDLSNAKDAAKAVTTIDEAIRKVSTERSKLGAYQNRLDHTIKNLDTSSENLQAAESRIRDVDMAKEMMTLTKNNILQQAAQAMLAQANQAPQGVLQLLR